MQRPVWLLPVVAVAALTLRRAQQMGALPTGPDGGTWLAIGRGLLGGMGRETPGAYAPLVPLATATLATVTGPVDAVRLVGFAASVAVLAAVGYVAWRAAGPVMAAGVIVAVGGASAVSEPLFFGGYPQLLATAALLVGLRSVAGWLVDGQARSLVVGAAALSIASASHHVYGVLALASATAAAMLWLVAARPTGTRARARLPGFAAALAAAAAVLAPTLIAFRAAGYEPPLDAARFGLADAWRYATREAVAAWSLVTVAGVLALWITRRRPTAEWLAAAALLIAAEAGTAFSAEPRLVPAVLIASVLGIAAALPNRLPAGAVGALAAGALALAIAGDRIATDYAAFYRVLDRSTLGAAAFVESANPAGLVAVHADRRGWPAGWWYEGLTEQRIAVGSDPRWLGFPGERDQAELVAELFAPGQPANSMRHIADAAGVELLVAGKWEWIGWDRWLAEPEPVVVVAYDDDETIVLRIVPRGPAPQPAAENAGV